MKERNLAEILCSICLIFLVATPVAITMGVVDMSLNNSNTLADVTYHPSSVTIPSVDDEPAPLRNGVMNGLWFPKAIRSELSFEVELDRYAKIHIDIDCVNDVTGRYFYLILDGQTIYTEVIREDGFHETVNINHKRGVHHLTLQIYWGAYADEGWLLRSIYTDDNYDNIGYDTEILSVYFPQQAYSQLNFEIEAGLETQMDLQVVKENEYHSRYFSAFVDGQVVVPESSSYTIPFSSSKNFDLGDYDQHSTHKLTLQVRWGDYREWGYKIKLNSLHHENRIVYTDTGFFVHYLSQKFEVDYMNVEDPDGVWTSQTLRSHCDYLEKYYIEHGFQRIEFVIDQEIPFMSVISSPADLFYQYFQHDAENEKWLWTWVLFCNKDSSHPGTLGSRLMLDGYYIDVIRQGEIFDHMNRDYGQGIRGILFHEVGHIFGIPDMSADGDDYCDVNGCAMSNDDSGLIITPWYCTYHWSCRYFAYPPTQTTTTTTSTTTSTDTTTGHTFTILP